jgi:hypothetical protein
MMVIVWILLMVVLMMVIMMVMIIVVVKMTVVQVLMLMVMVMMMVTEKMVLEILTPSEAVECVLETHKNVSDFVRAVRSKETGDEEENQHEGHGQVGGRKVQLIGEQETGRDTVRLG